MQNQFEIPKKPKTLTPPQQNQFEEGIKLILDRWYVLNLAIEMQWGSGEPSIKKGVLYENILQLFQTRKDLDELDLEDFFDEFFQIEFEVQAEDGSLSEVARDLINLHEQCSRNNFSKLDHLRSYQPFKIDKQHAVQMCEGGEGRDQDMDDEDENDSDAMEVIEEEPKQVKNGPIIDEDGFQLVQSQ
eukprot:TRINITY_DN6393_c1_g1_i6.p1 TRINITY_DN6393_c1_g1~~TRINITY_DN6393_c1_g1_i6.p1  ORF type:complete len:187 (-),score=39.18 TRINITY_DN6393_c1_g1_i6:77-637(-)